MTASAPAGNELLGAPFFQDQLKLGLKASKKLGSKASQKLGLKNSKKLLHSSTQHALKALTTAVVDMEAASGSCQKEQQDSKKSSSGSWIWRGPAVTTGKDRSREASGVEQQVSNLLAWTDRAQKAVAEKVSYAGVPREELDEDDELRDVEMGEGSAWLAMKKAAVAAKKKVDKATKESINGLKQGIPKETFVGHREPTPIVSQGKEHSADVANIAKASSLPEIGRTTSRDSIGTLAGGQTASQSIQKLTETKCNGGAATKVQDVAPAAATTGKSKLSEVGESMTLVFSGAASLARNPIKLAQFLGILVIVLLTCRLLFTSFPVLWHISFGISRRKCALLLAFGTPGVMVIGFLKSLDTSAPKTMQTNKPPFEARICEPSKV